MIKKEEHIEDNAASSNKWWKKPMKWLLALLLGLTLFLLLLQVPVIQKGLINAIANRIEKKIDRKISIEKVYLNVFKGLQLNGFAVLDTSLTDTLLAFDRLNISLTDNLMTLFQGDLNLNTIDIQGSRINITKPKGDTKTDLALILDKLKGDTQDTTETSRSLNLDIKNVGVSDIQYTVLDENTGSITKYKINRAIIKVDSFDTNHGRFLLSSFYAKEPYVEITKGNGTVLTKVEGKELEEIQNEVTSKQSKTVLEIKQFEIESGTFVYRDLRDNSPSIPKTLNPKNLKVSKINLNADSIKFETGFALDLDLKSVSFVDNEGFVLDNLSSDNVKINKEEIVLPNLNLKTDKSNIASKLILSTDEFADYNKFVENVYISADFNRSVIAIDDIVHFLPKLSKTDFFANNRDRTFRLNGALRGPVQNLSGRNITLTENGELSFKGNFSSINLTGGKNAFVNLKVDKLTSSVTYLRQLIPGFNPPTNFNKIGDFDFQGRFDGYFEDFIAFGLLKSDLGTADLDMRLDVKLGNEKAEYNGVLRLIDFDLGKWSDQTDLGKVNFIAEVKQGNGLTLSSATADLIANIEKLEYKGYTYNDLQLNGTLDENEFNGDFSARDENIDLTFEGKVTYSKDTIDLDLTADIQKILLKNINLSDKISSISGQINGAKVYGKGFDGLTGRVQASNLTIEADTTYRLDTVSFNSFSGSSTSNRIEFYSEIVKGEINGLYRLDQLMPQFKKIIKSNYPYHTRSWKVDTNFYAINKFDIEVEIFDTKNLFDLLGAKGLKITDLQSKGQVDSENGIFNLDINAGEILYKNNAFYNSDIIVNNRNKYGFLVLNVDSTVINGKTYNPLYLETDLNSDSISFGFSADKIVDSVDVVFIEGSLIPHPSGYKISIKDRDLSMLGSKWKIYTDNAVVFGKEYIDIRDLIISDGYREIDIEDIDNKGVTVKFSRFNFRTLNGIIDYDKIDFTGEGDVTIRVENLINDQTYIQANMYVDDLRLNEESYGKLNIFFDKKYDESYKVLLSIDKGEQNVKANFTYNAETDLVDGFVRGKKFPLDIFEFIIDDGISETTGTGDVNATISGSLNNLKINGKAVMSECGVKIDYLGTSFFVDNQSLKISENLIDLSGVVLTDVEGNEGVISGGLRHDLFRDFRLDLNMSANNAVIIDTDKADNPLYYGKGKGKVNVAFTGSFDATNMDIRAETREGTLLNIPVKYTETGYEESFITFIEKEKLLAPKSSDERDEFKIEGLNITMDLTMTEAADVNIIFNERLGDIIQGNGRGNLQIIVKRTGEFQIFGDYEVEEGEYLFTARNLVAKSFKVRRGGEIKWTGDPINAALDLRADYLIRSPLNVFLNEFLIDPSSQAYREASNAQNIKLILELGGTLFSPDVNFDLEFPDLVGELNSYAQSKLRTLRTNEIALNSQVFGLLLSGQFLPDNNPLNSNLFGSGELVQTGISTIGEFITSQLSRLFTGLLQEALSENGLIAGVDFEIGLRNNTGFFSNQGNATSDLYPDEITLNLRNRFRFLDERLSLGGGFNYVRESPLQGVNDYYIPNIVVEYFLTDDRQLKLRFYYRRDIDELSLNARRDRLGLGIGYRTEFGSMSDAIRKVTESVDPNGSN